MCIFLRRCFLITILTLSARAESLDSTFELSPAMTELIHTPRRAPADWKERTGAVFLNQEWEKDRKIRWYVELQRDGGRWVQAGLAHRNEETIAWGLKQLQWGLKQMAEDGSFTCDDAFHSATFLVETTAHSILLIESSPFAKTFQPQVAELKKPLLRCALWMASSFNFSAAEKQRIYTHRRFLVGCALMQTALIHDNKLLRQTAEYFIQDGTRMQRHDGAFLEKGGHDSSYHAVAMIYFQRILMVTPLEWQADSWKTSLDQGMRWMVGRVKENGEVEVKGNTRTGLGQEKGRTGQLKGVNLPEFATALIYYAHRTNDSKYEALARKVLGK